VQIANQNTMAVYSSATFSNKTLDMTGWDTYTVIGVIHRPAGGGGGTSAWNGVGTASYQGSTLTNGRILYRGQYLASQNVQYALVFQSDSRAVLYHNGYMWDIPGSLNSGADRLIMQGDGNLVLYRPNNTVVWHSVSSGHPGAWLELQSDGNAVVRDSGTAYWASGTGGHPNFTYAGPYLLGGQQINTDEYLRSWDWRHALLMQADGNAVLYGPGYHPVWATGNTGGGNRLVMQTDGNLVKYAGTTPTWNRGPYGSNNPTANLQDDGNFVIRLGGTTGPAQWSTGTAGQL
jgi:hypothetical protein